MAKSFVRVPSRKKGRPVRALHEIASEWQRKTFFETLQHNGDEAAARRASKITVDVLKRLLAEDTLFLTRFEEIKGTPDSKKRRFLNAFATNDVPDELAAAQAAQMSLATFKRLVDTDPEFAREYRELLEEFEAAMTAKLGLEGYGKDGRSANVPALVQAIRDRFPHRLRPQTTVAVQINATRDEIDAMTPEQLREFISRHENARR